MNALLESPVPPPVQDPRNLHRLGQWARKLRGSWFFLVALLLHMLAVVILGGMVLREYIIPPKYDEAQVFLPGENAGGETMHAETMPELNHSFGEEIRNEVQMTAGDFAGETPDMREIIIADGAANSFRLPEPGGGGIPLTGINQDNESLRNALLEARKSSTPQTRPVNRMDAARLTSIQNRIGASAPGKGFDIGQTGRNGVGGVQATFTCYVARYAGGDWDHNVTLSPDGLRITFGAIPNLMTQITRWNKRLKAQVEAVPLDLSDRAALFESKPPVAFVYFTGHRDFRLTDAEVGNLREFIMAGGVIWGDAGMPGRNSRFDTAFRREMRRVLPDADQEFQPLDHRHEIFTQKGSLVKTVPQGMNFYREPIEVMMVGGQIGVIYTLNSYGNLWQMALDEQGKILEVFDEGTEKSPNQTHTNRLLWQRRATYYRNVDRDTVTRAYQLGMNIIVHILLQYQEEMNRR